MITLVHSSIIFIYLLHEISCKNFRVIGNISFMLVWQCRMHAVAVVSCRECTARLPRTFVGADRSRSRIVKFSVGFGV